MVISKREPALSESVGCVSCEASFWAAFPYQKEASWPEKGADYLCAEASDFRFVGNLWVAEIPLVHPFKEHLKDAIKIGLANRFRLGSIIRENY